MGNGVAFQDIALKIWRLLQPILARLFENSMITACRACWLLYYDDGDGFEIRPRLTYYSKRRGGRAVDKFAGSEFGQRSGSEAGPEGVTYREAGHSAPGTGAYELAVPIKDRLLKSERWQSG